MQANYLYSCWAFSEFAPGFKDFLEFSTRAYEGHMDDLYVYLMDTSAPQELVDKFTDTILHSAHNRDFFVWPERRHGMRMPDYR